MTKSGSRTIITLLAVAGVAALALAVGPQVVAWARGKLKEPDAPLPTNGGEGATPAANQDGSLFSSQAMDYVKGKLAEAKQDLLGALGGIGLQATISNEVERRRINVENLISAAVSSASQSAPASPNVPAGLREYNRTGALYIR